MKMGKPLTEKMKKQISDFYHNRDMSIGSIAETLGVSRDSVRRHRYYLNQDPSESMSVEKAIPPNQNYAPQNTVEEPETPIQSNQNQIADETVEPDNIDYETETIPDNDDFSEKKSIEYVEVTKCPQCDNPKANWIRIDELEEDDPQPTEIQRQFYSYVCPNCMLLIPEKRCYIAGVCPECHSTSIDWMTIEDALKLGWNIKEEDAEYYTHICMDCMEYLKVTA